MNKQFFFVYDKSCKPANIQINSGYSIYIFKPKLYKLKLHKKGPILLYLYWFLFTFGKYRIWYVKDDKNNIVHFSIVVTKFYRFPFMKKDDLHIINCHTSENHRGKGIYPYVLNDIINKNNNKKIWILANHKNIPSQKGILKAGFKKIGEGYITKYLKIYKLQQ